MGPGGMRPGGNGMTMPDGFDPNQFGNGQKPGDLPDSFDPSQFGNFDPSQFGNINPNQFGNGKPDGQMKPDNMPDNFDPSQFGNGQGRPDIGQWGNQENMTGEVNMIFEIVKGSNMFGGIS